MPGFHTLKRAAPAIVLCFVPVLAGGSAYADSNGLQTRFHCSTPDVPKRFISEQAPADYLILKSAMRRGSCTYVPGGVSVTPLRFLYRVRSAGAGSSYGYVWEVRLSNGRSAYWFFSQTKHRRTLQMHSAQATS